MLRSSVCTSCADERCCGSLAESSRAIDARCAASMSIRLYDAGPVWSSIVVKIDRVPSWLSTSSISRECCGKSKTAVEALLISQNPLGPVGARVRP